MKAQETFPFDRCYGWRPSLCLNYSLLLEAILFLHTVQNNFFPISPPCALLDFAFAVILGYLVLCFINFKTCIMHGRFI